MRDRGHNYNPYTSRHRVRGAPGLYPREHDEADLPPLWSEPERSNDEDNWDEIAEETHAAPATEVADAASVTRREPSDGSIDAAQGDLEDLIQDDQEGRLADE